MRTIIRCRPGILAIVWAFLRFAGASRPLVTVRRDSLDRNPRASQRPLALGLAATHARKGPSQFPSHLSTSSLVRHRSYRHTRPWLRTVASPAGHGSADLESVLGATPQEFEFRIPHHRDQPRRSSRKEARPHGVRASVLCLPIQKTRWEPILIRTSYRH